MLPDSLVRELFEELCQIRLIDPHSHVNPLAATARTLDDLLGYHYYTELAHSAGMHKRVLAAGVPPLDRVRELLQYSQRFSNTVQYGWLVEIARDFFGYQKTEFTGADAEKLWSAAERVLSQQDWESQVLRRTNVERIFLTNDFDDPLQGFDTKLYVPCLRTDDLVFHLGKEAVWQRLAQATGIEIGDARSLRQALSLRFAHFVKHGAKACAISLPPRFAPRAVSTEELDRALRPDGEELSTLRILGTFWLLADLCREYQLPFDLMVGVNRQVYLEGVHQGQDLFDQRTSLILFADLFNAFPEVTFPVSVLNSPQNQELVGYAWIFPNVVTSGHWWYSNVPAFIEQDCRARLEAVPQTKQLGYYSDAYKLEFILPKFNTYRQVLARVLAERFMRDRGWDKQRALRLGRLLLRENAQEIFRLD